MNKCCISVLENTKKSVHCYVRSYKMSYFVHDSYGHFLQQQNFTFHKHFQCSTHMGIYIPTIQQVSTHAVYNIYCACTQDNYMMSHTNIVHTVCLAIIEVHKHKSSSFMQNLKLSEQCYIFTYC